MDRKYIYLAILICSSLLSSCGNTIAYNDALINRSSISEINITSVTSTSPKLDEIKAYTNRSETIIPIMKEQATEISDDTISDNSDYYDQDPYFNDNIDISYKIENSLVPLADCGGTYSVSIYFKDRESIINVGNHSSPMVSASLIKLFVAGCVYENYDNMIPYEAYENETEYLIGQMISISCNDSCNILVNRLGDGDPANGMAKVNAYCEEHGYFNSRMNRLMLDFNGLENYTSTNDVCSFLYSIYNNELEGSEKILDYMKKQSNRSKIPAGIDRDIIVANKTGELYNVENDAAIVFADPEPYIICIMTNNITDPEQVRYKLSEVSYQIYQFYLGN